MPYHLYAHWLDSEYRKSGSPVGSPTGIQRLLKIHALLGTQIVLSDVQLLDSYGVIESFQDPKFLRFIRNNPDMLGFSAQSHSDDEPTLSRLTAGFRRSLRPDWRATALDTGYVKTLAEKLMSRGTRRVLDDLNSNEMQHLYHACPALQAVLLAMKHFSENSQFVYPSAPPGGSFTPLLERAAEQVLREDTATHAEHHRILSHTLDFIGRIGPQATRSQVLAILPEADLDIVAPGITKAAVWQTVIHAWNSNVQRSVIPSSGSGHHLYGGGSIGALAEGVPVGRYIDRERDALIVATPPPEGPRAMVAGHLAVDPGILDWSAIRQLREDTDETRVEYQNALSTEDTDAVHAALERHLAKLRESLAKMRPPEKPPMGYDLLSLVVGAFYVLFGDLAQPMVTYLALNQHRLTNTTLEALSWGDRTLMVSAIQDQAPNPRR